MIEIPRSEEHTSELQSLRHLVCRLLLEKKKHCQPPPKSYKARICAGAMQAAVVRWRRAEPQQVSSDQVQRDRPRLRSSFFFFFNKRGPPEFYPFPLPAALPI